MLVRTRIAQVFAICAAIAVFLPTLVSAEEASTEEVPAQDEPIVDERPDNYDDAVDLFTRTFVWSEDTTVVGVDQYGRQMSSQTYTNFYQGRHKRLLDGDEFYDVVQRPDLADSYRSRNRTRAGLMLGGLGGSVIGAGLLVYGMSSMTSGLYEEEPDDGISGSSIALWSGIGLLVAGPIAMWTGAAINPHPVEPHEARELAEDYNLRLVDELELESEDLPEEGDTPGVDDLRVDVFFGDEQTGGGGLMVGGRF